MRAALPIHLRTYSMLWLVLTLAIAVPASAQPESDTSVAESARRVLDQAAMVQRNGQHHQSLRGLRRLRAPSLEPMFQRLTQADHPALRLHGRLGIAELSDKGQLSLESIATMQPPAAVAELVAAGLDDGLLSPERAAELMRWDGLSPGIKTLIAGRLLATGTEFDPQPLQAALNGGNLGQRALAALLLLQLGNDSMRDRLDQVGASASPQRDAVLAMLLRAAMRHELERAGPWAMSLATEPNSDPRLKRLALECGLRFGEPGAAAAWTQAYQDSDDPAQRMRLALLALRVSPWAPSSIYEQLTGEPHDTLLGRAGRVGAAIATDAPADAPWVALIQTEQPQFIRWALRYGQEQASPQFAERIAMAVIRDRHAENGSTSADPMRVQQVAEATSLLCQSSPGVAASRLRKVLVSSSAAPDDQQGVLLGLLRQRGSGASELPRIDLGGALDGVNGFDNLDTSGLFTLLRAKHGMSLLPAEQRELGLLVQGGGGLDVGLRTQAAWAYLKQTGAL